MGFDETSEALKNFSFKDLFADLIAVPFDFITSVINWIPTVFTDPVQAMQDLWNGIVGEGGLLDIIYAPIDKAVGFIMDIFGFDEPDTALTDEEGNFIGLKDLAIKAVMGVYDYVKSFFQFDFPSVGELFQGAKNVMENLLKTVLPAPDFLTFKVPELKIPFVGTVGGGEISLNPIPDGIYEAAGIDPKTGVPKLTGDATAEVIEGNTSNTGESLKTEQANGQNGTINIVNANDNSNTQSSSSTNQTSGFAVEGTDTTAKYLAAAYG